MARQKNSEIDAQLRALTAPASATQKDWVGTPFIEALPGYLMLRDDVQDIEKMDSLRDVGREAYAEDFDECFQRFDANGAWKWYLKDGRIVFTTGEIPK